MAKKILVTGGSGWLGTHVMRHFAADDMSRRSGNDILDAEQCARVGHYDVVIHLAALLDKRPEAAEEVFDTNVRGTINILKHIKPGAAFIFASTKDVYGRFADNYGEVNEDCPTMYSGQSALEWSKLVAERYVEYYAHTRKFRSCIFRMSTVYAPPSGGNTPNFVGHFAEMIDRGETLRLPGSGRPMRDILHVDDFARACEAFFDSVITHGLYNIGGGAANAFSLLDLVIKLERVSGLHANIDEEDPLPDPVPWRYISDNSRVSQELGWTPAVKPDDGLKSLFEA
jgi:nucleoside-diphosphate-sugar epimerase